MPKPIASHSRNTIDLARLGLPGLLTVGQRRQFSVAPVAWSSRSAPHAMEICYLASGRQRITLPTGQTRVLAGNDIHINHPGTWHTLHQNISDRCHIFYLSFDLRSARLKLLFPPSQAMALRRALLALPTHLRGDPHMHHLFTTVLTATTPPHPDTRLPRRDPPLQQLQSIHAVQSLILYVLTLASRTHPQTFSPTVQRVRNYIARHLHETLDVPALAAVASLSPSRFHTRFKQETGLPPREYVLRAKIDAAQLLLPTRSVTSTAAALGFTSTQYFATVFRRYTGQSPSSSTRPTAKPSLVPPTAPPPPE